MTCLTISLKIDFLSDLKLSNQTEMYDKGLRLCSANPCFIHQLHLLPLWVWNIQYRLTNSDRLTFDWSGCARLCTAGISSRLLKCVLEYNHWLTYIYLLTNIKLQNVVDYNITKIMKCRLIQISQRKTPMKFDDIWKRAKLRPLKGSCVTGKITT